MLSLDKFDSFVLAEFLSEFFLRSIFIESLLSVFDDEAGDFAKDLSVDDLSVDFLSTALSFDLSLEFSCEFLSAEILSGDFF